jgi:hypothetical protein
MPQYRVFSNQNTLSFNDYIKIKKNKNKICKKCCNKCNKNICDKSPLSIVQARTSYICKNNVDSRTCNQEILYPYGLYLCQDKICNECESSEKTTKSIETYNNSGNYTVYDLFEPLSN